MLLFHSDGRNSMFRRGCSFDVTSILRAGLLAGGKQSKEGRQTVFFTPSKPVWGQSRGRRFQRRTEAEKSTMSQYMQASSGRRLLGPLGQGTRKESAVLADTLSRPGCSRFSAGRLHRKKVISMKGHKTAYQRLSTPRPAPKIVLKKVS